MVHVRPLPGRAGCFPAGTAGAYAIVLALVRDEAGYREIVAAEMESLGLFIAELEHLAPYEPHEDDADDVRLCAAKLAPQWPVQYHNFNTYPDDDA